MKNQELTQPLLSVPQNFAPLSDQELCLRMPRELQSFASQAKVDAKHNIKQQSIRKTESQEPGYHMTTPKKKLLRILRLAKARD